MKKTNTDSAKERWRSFEKSSPALHICGHLCPSSLICVRFAKPYEKQTVRLVHDDRDGRGADDGHRRVHPPPVRHPEPLPRLVVTDSQEISLGSALAAQFDIDRGILP